MSVIEQQTGPVESGEGPPQRLVQLSELVWSCPSSSCTHWHKIKPHYLTHVLHSYFLKNSDSTQHLQWAISEQWNSFGRVRVEHACRAVSEQESHRQDLWQKNHLIAVQTGVRRFREPWSMLKVKYDVERVIEEGGKGKLGTVTDLASVSLRSISAGLKLNTRSCNTLLRTYLHSGTLSSRDQAWQQILTSTRSDQQT